MNWIAFIIAAALGTIMTILWRPTFPKGWKKRLLLALVIIAILVLIGFVFGLRFVTSLVIGSVAGPVGFFLLLFFIACAVLFLVFRGNPGQQEDKILRAH